MRLAFLPLLALMAFSAPAAAQPAPAASVEAQLCRSQLDLLVSRGRLTQEEQARFDRQCQCLEDQAVSGETGSCTLPDEDF